MSKNNFEISNGEEGLIVCACGSKEFKATETVVTLTGQVDGPTSSNDVCVCIACGERVVVKAS